MTQTIVFKGQRFILWQVWGQKARVEVSAGRAVSVPRSGAGGGTLPPVPASLAAGPAPLHSYLAPCLPTGQVPVDNAERVEGTSAQKASRVLGSVPKEGRPQAVGQPDPIAPMSQSK